MLILAPAPRFEATGGNTRPCRAATLNAGRTLTVPLAVVEETRRSLTPPPESKASWSASGKSRYDRCPRRRLGRGDPGPLSWKPPPRTGTACGAHICEAASSSPTPSPLTCGTRAGQHRHRVRRGRDQGHRSRSCRLLGGEGRPDDVCQSPSPFALGPFGIRVNAVVAGTTDLAGAHDDGGRSAHRIHAIPLDRPRHAR